MVFWKITFIKKFRFLQKQSLYRSQVKVYSVVFDIKRLHLTHLRTNVNVKHTSSLNASPH